MTSISIESILRHWSGLDNVPGPVSGAAFSVVQQLFPKYGIPSCEVHDGSTGYYFDLVYHPFKGNSNYVMIRFPERWEGTMTIQDAVDKRSHHTLNDVVQAFEFYLR